MADAYGAPLIQTLAAFSKLGSMSTKSVMPEFPKPECVVSFEVTHDAFYETGNPQEWRGTPEYAAAFRRHRVEMLPFAEAGNVAAQYAVALVHFLMLEHATEQDAIDAYPSDSTAFSMWLARAASAGHLIAIDNLISIGVGEEADRLRTLYRENKSQFSLSPPPTEEWLKDMSRLHQLAYGGG